MSDEKIYELAVQRLLKLPESPYQFDWGKIMAKPTQQEIDEWNARMNEPEDDGDDFEVEIVNPDGHAARVPYKKAKGYLQEHFGIDLELPAPEGDPNGIQDPAGNGQGPAPQQPGVAARHFGSKAK